MPPSPPVNAQPGSWSGRLAASLRSEHLRAALVLLALLVVFFWKPIAHYRDGYYSPADLTQGFSLTKIEPGLRPGNQLQSDAVTQMEPWLVFNQEEVAAGRFPLWNPYNGAGCPHFANYQSGVLSPFRLPEYFLDARAGLLVRAMLKLFVLGFFTYLFLRRLGLAWLPALVGGTAFQFAGHNVLLLYFPHVGALCVLPLGLYCVEVALQNFERGIRTGERARVAVPLAGLALSIATGLLAGNPEPFYFGAVTLLVWTLARLVRLMANPEARRAIAIAACKIAGAATIGVGLAAVQLVPFSEYLHQSHVFEERSAHQTPLDPHWWPLALFPDVLGSPAAPYLIGFDVPKPNYELVNMEYTGGLATFLFLASLVFAWRDRKLLFFALGGLAWLVYAHDIGGAWKIFAWIPSVDLAPINRSQGVWNFLVACAAAFALDRVTRQPPSRSWALALGALVAAGAFLLFCRAGAQRIIADHAHIATPFQGEFGAYVPFHIAWMSWAFALGAAAFAALAVVRASAWRALLATLVLAAVFAQSGLWLRDYNPTSEKRFYFPRTEAVSELQRLVGRERLAVLGEDMLPPDSNLAYGLNLLQNYDGMWVRDLDYLYRDHFGDEGNWRPIVKARERDLRLFGARWVLAKWGWNFLDSGRMHERRDTESAPVRRDILPGQDLTQTFRVRKHGLDAVMVFLSVLPGGEPARLVVEIKDVETGRIVHHAETTGTEVLSTLNSRRDIERPLDPKTNPIGRPVVFSFARVPDSRSRTYELRLSNPDTTPAAGICAWSSGGALLYDFSCSYSHYERVARLAEFELFRLAAPTGEFTLVDDAVLLADDERVLDLLRSPSFDPRERVVFDARDKDVAVLRLEPPAGRAPAPRVVSFSDSDRCFLVAPDGKTLAGIEDEDEAQLMSDGFRWKDLQKLPAGDKAQYTILKRADKQTLQGFGLGSTESELRRRLRRRVVQFADSDWCYLVDRDGRGLVHIEDEATFLANGFRWDEIQKLPAEERAKFTIVPDSDRDAMRRAGLRVLEQGTAAGPMVTVVEQTPTLARLVIDRAQGGWLVRSQAHFPGWKARIDGRETPILRANYAFDALLVPSGRHTIEFSYEPESLRQGLWLSALSLLAGVVGLVAETRRRPWSWLPRERPSTTTVLIAAVAAALAYVIFVRMSTRGINSDILSHISIARREIAAGRWFSYTLWSPLIIVVSGNGSVMNPKTASVLLLTIAVAAKAVLSRAVIREWGAENRTAILCALGCIVATPVLALGDQALHGMTDTSVLSGAIYLGRFSPTVWHNSTSIASLPLIIVAAAASRRALASPALRACIAMGLWLAASALMKPSFVMASMPVLAPVLLWRLYRGPAGTRTRIACLAWAFVPALLVILAQAQLIRTDPVIVVHRFVWDPLSVWRHYAASPLRAALQSLAFPILASVTILYLGKRNQWWLWCSWAVMAVAIAELALIGERIGSVGAENYDGNWFWGPHAAILILFLASVAALASAASVPGKTIRGWPRVLLTCSWIAFGLHVATGVLYVWRLFQFQNGFAS